MGSTSQRENRLASGDLPHDPRPAVSSDGTQRAWRLRPEYPPQGDESWRIDAIRLTKIREQIIARPAPTTMTVRSGAKVSVLEVPPGSVIVLKDVLLTDLRHMLHTLYEALGHKQFAVITIEGDSDVQCWGPDVDLKAKIDAMLKSR